MTKRCSSFATRSRRRQETRNTGWRLGLALAKANHPAEASVYLNALLKRDPENALANLGEARIAAAQGKTADAVKFYRRAIDGVVAGGPGADPDASALRTGVATGKSRAKTQAIAELLAASGAARDHTMKKKIGSCCSATARLARLRTSFGIVRRTIAMRMPMRVWARLSWRWRITRRRAMRSRRRCDRNPSDEASKKQLDLSERVLALDPNARGLRAAERYERSKELLQAEVMRFDQCQPGSTSSRLSRGQAARQPSAPGRVGGRSRDESRARRGFVEAGARSSAALPQTTQRDASDPAVQAINAF